MTLSLSHMYNPQNQLKRSQSTAETPRKRKSSTPVRSTPKGYKDYQPGVVLKLDFGNTRGCILRSVNMNAYAPSAERIEPVVSNSANTIRTWRSTTSSQSSSPTFKSRRVPSISSTAPSEVSSPTLRNRSRQGSLARNRSSRIK
jgi:hypothetical protein